MNFSEINTTYCAFLLIFQKFMQVKQKNIKKDAKMVANCL